jgi:type 1 glutamine amidotransferase
MKIMNYLAPLLAAWLIGPAGLAQAKEWVTYEGKAGPGMGKHIVFLSGDEEYRSEEGLTMLARIMAVRHGFKCTVLYAIDPADGTIAPTVVTNIPGMEMLDGADLCVMKLRFRQLPDAQMKPFVDYVNSGKPIVALRTATHAFNYNPKSASPYKKYSFNSKEWPGGFGQQVLGETWVNHHGNHGVESTRGLVNEEFKDHPILRGVSDIWGPTDVYTVSHLTRDDKVLVRGQVLKGMKPTDPPVDGPKNDPMMPLAWIRTYQGEAGRAARVFTTTMGASVDLESAGLRRLIVNASYWALGLEDKIGASGNVDYVGEYKPTWFGFGKFKKGVKPADLELR